MDTFNNVIKNKSIILGLLIYSIISLLIIFYNHHYYDDEVRNLEMLSLSFTEIFNIVQHPGKILKPLSVNFSGNILVFSTFWHFQHFDILKFFFKKKPNNLGNFSNNFLQLVSAI